jgi:hypothetical protein
VSIARAKINLNFYTCGYLLFCVTISLSNQGLNKMRKNTKLTDSLIEQAQQWFPAFRLPIAWDSMRGYNLAEWQNGFVEDFGEFHLIRINFKKHKNTADLFETICHELIHAWQFENNIETNHGLEFCEWVIKFSAFGINTASPDCKPKTLKKAKCRIMKKAKKYFE